MGGGEKERPRTTASGLMSFRVLEKRNNECTSHTCECGLGLSLSPSPSRIPPIAQRDGAREEEAGWLAGLAWAVLRRVGPGWTYDNLGHSFSLFLRKQARWRWPAAASMASVGRYVRRQWNCSRGRLPLALSHARSLAHLLCCLLAW